MSASGIRFNDYFFSEPVHLGAWAPPQCAGLLSILVNDPNWAPKAFQPLYFGEFGNNTPPAAVLQDCSPLMAAAKGKTLYVSVLPMPFSTTQQRLSLRNELIVAYNPVCQAETAKAQPRDLEYKVAELEKKHQEHTAQMMHFMAGMNPQVETPKAPRRRIGFVA